MNWRRILGGALLLLGAGLGLTPSRADAPLQVGEAIYRFGVLGSGAALEGDRKDSAQGVRGAGAACVHCHRNSGLGSREGDYAIPPISGRFLFHGSMPDARHAARPHVPGERMDRQPYTEASLARAIREGLDPDGKPLGYLMPRFALDDADMAALITYLKALSPHRLPGVTPDLLHFATIVTPDADPVKRSGMLDVLEHFFAEKNAMAEAPSRAPASREPGQSGILPAARLHWQLHVWQLQGPPSDWPAQLRRFNTQQPVMAVISGLGGTDWSPVHDFCEAAHLPCLFPNLEVPVEGEHDFYSLYFSKGVLLEAQLMARRIGSEGGNPGAGPVQQVYREGDNGAAGARALAAALEHAGRGTQAIVIPAGTADTDVRKALERASGQGPLVLWLRPQDLSALAGMAPPARPIFASGLMAGLDSAPLPVQWRPQVLLSYPVDLPAHRLVQVDYPLGWFRLRRIPVVAQPVQVDTYLACGMLVEALGHMGDNFVPEYLVEQIEDMVGHRTLTGYYPRLSLAEGQRFASKGGYLVQLDSAGKGGVSPASDWVVP